MAEGTIQVLLADDDEGFLESLRTLIDQQQGFSVVGTATEDDGTSWGNSGDDEPPLFDDPNGAPANFNELDFDELFPPELVDGPPPPDGGSGSATGGTTDAVTNALTGLTGGL